MLSLWFLALSHLAVRMKGVKQKEKNKRKKEVMSRSISLLYLIYRFRSQRREKMKDYLKTVLECLFLLMETGNSKSCKANHKKVA